MKKKVLMGFGALALFSLGLLSQYAYSLPNQYRSEGVQMAVNQIIQVIDTEGEWKVKTDKGLYTLKNVTPIRKEAEEVKK